MLPVHPAYRQAAGLQQILIDCRASYVLIEQILKFNPLALETGGSYVSHVMSEGVDSLIAGHMPVLAVET